MNKNKKGILVKNLFENESAIAPSQTDPVTIPVDVSLDQKVDKYLIAYEKESIPTAKSYEIPQTQSVSNSGANGGIGVVPSVIPNTQQVGESKKFKKGILESYLFEAEGDDPMAGPDDAGGSDMGGFGGGDDDTGAPTGEPSDIPVVNTPKINLQNYAMGVARLVNNYESLLNPKITILNRASEYIKVNYDEATSKQFEELMEQNYDIRKEEPLRDDSMAPLAAGSGGGNLGSGGGGGSV